MLVDLVLQPRMPGYMNKNLTEDTTELVGGDCRRLLDGTGDGDPHLYNAERFPFDGLRSGYTNCSSGTNESPSCRARSSSPASPITPERVLF